MPLPLDGLIVLDLTLARAGPTCVRHLADWGATIWRVEPPGSADGFGGARDGFDSVNLHRNKRSIALDLKNPAGRAAFLRLAAKADVLVENMRVAVKHRLKIGPEEIAAVNPRLVYASISGFGQTGPYAGRGGVDQIAQGMGGLMSITGEAGRGPMRVGIPINDLTAGNLLALAIMMKLFERERTGMGGSVHTSLLEAQVFMLDFQATRFLMDGEVAGQAGNDHPVNTPMGVFPAADKPINIAASSAKLWEVFCRVCGREDWLAKPEWQTAKGRTADRPALNAAIAEETRKHPSEWWIAKLEEAGIPCGPVNDIREVFEDPQVQHLDMVWHAPHERLGQAGVVRTPLNIDGHKPGVHRGVPALGGDAEEILAQAGLSGNEIKELRATGALGDAAK
ncbi:CaiB/BaiF CoA transferase family protein [Sabulicella rubraurantiaca]|uniref:CaiB/BaiF CoA transferase family protein n=1 Tax=Sabulicella rubraurantiaca TaxID=2811429 RepID=UPI001A962207|nr:CoA transferase [Sabulicella rubraurantiaca]